MGILAKFDSRKHRLFVNCTSHYILCRNDKAEDMIKLKTDQMDLSKLDKFEQQNRTFIILFYKNALK